VIERVAIDRGHDPRTMPSGAGHDAQMFARVCPSAMIFVPSRDGLSHNAAEFTEPSDLIAGANVLLHTLLHLANRP
jgi:N-carbamoyl-L-amino-acid hydrolase